MQKIKDFLKGKKTYLAAASGILLAAVSFSEDALTLVQVIEVIFAAVLACTVRAGVAKGPAK